MRKFEPMKAYKFELQGVLQKIVRYGNSFPFR